MSIVETKTERKNLYEGMYIINSTLSEEARGKALERITNEIASHGGEVHKVHDMGTKKLAYEIDGKKEGYYFLVYFSVVPSAIKEIWKEYHLNEDLIRFITLRAHEVMEEIKFKQIDE